jgi:hypothetical protein
MIRPVATRVQSLAMKPTNPTPKRSWTLWTAYAKLSSQTPSEDDDGRDRGNPTSTISRIR